MGYSQFIANYFSSRKPNAWAFLSFAAEFARQYPTITFGEANSRFLNALQKIAASPNSSAPARSKAQSLIDTLKNKSKKRPRQPDGLVIHGNVNIAPQGHIVNTRDGDVSISVEGPEKRQCREPTPAPGGGKQDGKGSTKRRCPELTPAPGVGKQDGKGSTKRRRSEPRPVPDKDKQDEEGSDEENDEAEEYDRGEEHDEYEEHDEVEEHNEEFDGEFNEYEDYDEYEEGAGTPPPYDDRLHAFLVAFRAMKHKRQFASGRILQDIIHIGVLENPSSAGEAIHWIIDLTDKTVMSWFTQGELKELLGWIPPTPQVDESFTYARERYRNKLSVADLRQITESTPRPSGVQYDRKSNFNATYVNSAASLILSVIEQNNKNESFGMQGHREGWYGSQLWSAILDHCMHEMDNFTVSRSEIQSKSGCPKKRFDAIFLGLAGAEITEFGAVEVARTADVLVPGKRTCDEEKLRDVMTAMLKALLVHVNHDVEASKLLQVVGVQQLGFNIRISTMCSVSKGVFFLKRGSWRKVPIKLDKFDSVFGVMQAVVVMKKIIQRTVETINQYYEKKSTEEGFEL